MLDGMDIVFATRLERVILETLMGNREVPGLVRNLANSPNWDTFNRNVGQIQAYERVLDDMRGIVRHINGEETAKPQADKSMN